MASTTAAAETAADQPHKPDRSDRLDRPDRQLETDPSTAAALDALHAFVQRHPRLLLLTGAGISTASGIPGYRDASGNWLGRKPTMLAEFLASPFMRQRYWARGMVGWPTVAAAEPNAAHHAVATLQRRGHVRGLVTQNVDGLHQRAGSTGVIELHGGLAAAHCLDCGKPEPRAVIQQRMELDNPDWRGNRAPPSADGDALLERDDFDRFLVPACLHCGGVLKPDVVFFGESVPRDRVRATLDALEQADALLVAGSSLTVYSGFRFCLAANQAGKPVAAINLGQTRADPLLALKTELPCDIALPALAMRLDA